MGPWETRRQHVISFVAAALATSSAHAAPIFLWGKQNTDFGTLALDSTNTIYTGQGTGLGTGSLSRYTASGSFVLRKNYSDAQFVPRIATASGGSSAIYGVGHHSGGMHTVRYDGSGNVIWNQNIAGAAVESAAGNAFGILAGGGTSNSLVIPHQGNGDGYAAKYDANGDFLWHAQFGGTSSDTVWDVASDIAGNAYLGGYTFGAITTPNLNTPHVGGSPSDAFVMSYDNSGNFRWGKQFGNASGDSIYAVATDHLGNVIVVGDTHASLMGPHLGGADIFVRKYDTNGNTIWSKQIGGPSDDRPRAVTTDGLGNIYIGGYTGSSLGAPNVPAPSGGPSFDALVGQLDPNGNINWWYQTGTPEQETIAHIAVGSNGNVYVEGHSFGQIFGGTTGEDFIFALNIPEPAGLITLGAPLLLILRRRSRGGSRRSCPSCRRASAALP